MTHRPPLLKTALDAVGEPTDASAVRRLVESLGGAADEVISREVGAPAVSSTRLRFASGVELILYDDVLVEVLLHLAPTSFATRGVDLSHWIRGVHNAATLDQLVAATDATVRFLGLAVPYLIIGDRFVRLGFQDDRGWKEPGNLRRVAVTATEPGLHTAPDADNCPTCSGLLVRTDDGIDVPATIDILCAAVAAKQLTEDFDWVAATDLRALHASRLLDRVETQLTCLTCRRIACFALHRDAPPTFGYYTWGEARRRPHEPIPPVEQWGDAARIAEAANAMRYVEHEPGVWFLVEQGDRLYLDARYTYSAIIDDSALIELDEKEKKAYRARGRQFIGSLAEQIHQSAPYQETSPYHSRDLFRGRDGKRWRAAVGAAITNHTWLAEQRRAARNSRRSS